eukprot:scaffold1307_cov200-Pinguiococcus_pyrenoidosus.AAC.11
MDPPCRRHPAPRCSAVGVPRAWHPRVTPAASCASEDCTLTCEASLPLGVTLKSVGGSCLIPVAASVAGCAPAIMFMGKLPWPGTSR